MAQPVPPFPIAEAQLVSLFMQSITFGVHLVVFSICLHRWFCRSQLPGFHTSPWPWVVVATALFAIGMADVSLNLHNNLVAFAIHRSQNGPNFQLRNVSGWVNVVRVSFLYSDSSYALNQFQLRRRCASRTDYCPMPLL